MIKIRKGVCLRGHDRSPDSLDGNRYCKQCKYIWNKENSVYDPEYRKEYYAKNKLIASERARAWAKANPDKVKRKKFVNRLKQYGLLEEQYNQMVLDQNGACAICGRKPFRALDIDHDHDTGLVRGLLCNSCNRAIGYLASPDKLDSAKQYLLKSRVE